MIEGSGTFGFTVAEYYAMLRGEAITRAIPSNDIPFYHLISLLLFSIVTKVKKETLEYDGDCLVIRKHRHSTLCSDKDTTQ